MKVPVLVDAVVLTVMVDEPEPVTVIGLKLAVAPVGRPVAVKVTVPLNPLMAAMLVVYCVILPCTTVWDVGVAEIVKSGFVFGFTTNVTFVV